MKIETVAEAMSVIDIAIMPNRMTAAAALDFLRDLKEEVIIRIEALEAELKDEEDY